MLINHYDEFSGRFLMLEVSEHDVALAREQAQIKEQGALRRTVVMRRCLRLLDSGATPEHVIGQAYNYGHLDGSGASALTEAEMHVLESLPEVKDGMLDIVKLGAPTFAEAVVALRSRRDYEF
jgi:hypothetical protein